MKNFYYLKCKSWICHEEIPYCTAIYCIPKDIIKKIPKFEHFLFKPKVFILFTIIFYYIYISYHILTITYIFILK